MGRNARRRAEARRKPPRVPLSATLQEQLDQAHADARRALGQLNGKLARADQALTLEYRETRRTIVKRYAEIEADIRRRGAAELEASR